MNRVMKAGGVGVLALGVVMASRLVSAEPPTGKDSSPAQRAGVAAQAFSGELRATLMAAMRDGGPTAAVRVWHDEAPRIAQRVEQAHGVRLGRVGVRSRQPANRLTGWQKDVLDGWQTSPPSGPPSTWSPPISQQAGTLRWAKAIETEGPCLACHGNAISPELQNTLKELYPDDPATGFSAGSLRGLLWVEVPATPESVRASATPEAKAKEPHPSIDARQPIAMTASQASALRGQMRSHLEHLEGVLLALSQNDTAAAADLLGQLTAPQARPHDGDYRKALPANWQRFSAPMQQSLREASGQAVKGNLPAVLGELGAATAQCNACHVTYRIETVD